LPDKLKKQVAYHVLYPQITISHTDFVEFDQSGRSKRIWRHYIYSKHRKSGNLLPLLYYDNFIGVLTVMMRKEVFSDVGGFNGKLVTGEDWELWIKLCKRGYNFGYINEILAKYRINNYSVSKNNARYEKAIRKVLNESVLSDSIMSGSIKRKARASYYLMFGRMYYKNSNIKKALKYYCLSFRNGHIDFALFIARVIFYVQCLWKKNIRETNRIGASSCMF
jgi:hypothetical protein